MKKYFVIAGLILLTFSNIVYAQENTTPRFRPMRASARVTMVPTSLRPIPAGARSCGTASARVSGLVSTSRFTSVSETRNIIHKITYVQSVETQNFASLLFLQPQHLSQPVRVLLVVPDVQNLYGVVDNRIHNGDLFHMEHPHFVTMIVQVLASYSNLWKSL